MTNILLLTVDDMNGDTPGCCGGQPQVTPTIDRLAAGGMLFRRAHVPVAVCLPSRSALLTGRWPHRNGAEGFEPVHDDVPVLNDLLRPRGYLTGILGKVAHLPPVERYCWDLCIDRPELGAGRDPARYAAGVAELLTRARAEHRPFFLMVNAHDPHRPFHGSDQERTMFTDEQRAGIPAPSRVFAAGHGQVPGFLPDLPAVQREIAEYLSSCRRADDVVAAALAELDSAGLADDTLVIFMSDNGMAFPFAKANCYLQSSRTPLIIRWPGRAPAGVVDDTHFVSTIDLFPLMCRAAGVRPSPDGDGHDLTELIDNGKQAGRDRVFTVFHETSAKRRYEMRCTQDARWGYIWNAWSDGDTEYLAENMKGRTWPAMTTAAASNANLAARVEHYVHRVPEELYDLAADPDCLTNRIAAPETTGVVAHQRRAMAEWMASTGDPLEQRYRQSLRSAGTRP